MSSFLSLYQSLAHNRQVIKEGGILNELLGGCFIIYPAHLPTQMAAGAPVQWEKPMELNSTYCSPHYGDPTVPFHEI